MKKIIIARDIKELLEVKQSFFRRADINLIAVSSNEDALEFHKRQHADLIIIDPGSTGLNSEEFCNLIRQSEELRAVSIILVCPAEHAGCELSAGSRANVILTLPVPPEVIIEKAHQLLNIPKRGAYRAPISIKVEGKFSSRPFLCISENVSSTGMLFSTEKDLSTGDIIICSFVLPDSTHIRANAEVIRAVGRHTDFDTNQYAIRFSPLNEAERRAIEAYVEQMKK